MEELEALIKAGAPLKMGAGGWMKRAGKLNLARELICARTPSSRTYKTLLISTIADDTRVYLRNGTAGGSDDNLHGYCLVARERKNGLGTLDDLWEDIATWLARGQ